MIRHVSGFLLLCLALAAPAGAAGTPTPSDVYRAGNFAAAATMAEAEPNASSLAFAARARIAEAMTQPGGFSLANLQKAEANASRALELDPDNVEAHLQAAVAIGFRGRIIGIMNARAEGLAEKAHAHLEQALRLDPGNSWALASLGAWHLEIVSHAGPILASLSYGASRNRGHALFVEALEKDPGNALLHFHFALSVLALDAQTYGEEARIALEEVIGARDPDALTRFIQLQAKALLTAMRSDTPSETKALVRRFQGYARS